MLFLCVMKTCPQDTFPLKRNLIFVYTISWAENREHFNYFLGVTFSAILYEAVRYRRTKLSHITLLFITLERTLKTRVYFFLV